MSGIFLYGPGGGGKTTLASTFTKLGYHVHYIDLDRKVHTMMNLQPMLQSGTISYEHIEFKKRSLKAVANLKLNIKYPTPPTDYLRIAETIDALGDPGYLPALIGDNKKPLNTVLVIDSVTRINEAMKSYLRSLTSSGKTNFDVWDAMLANYETFFTEVYKLQPEIYPHVIVIGHTRDDMVTTKNEESTSQYIESRPLIDGQMREKVSTYVDEMYYCQSKALNPNQPAKFTCLTKPMGRVIHARSSRELPTSCESDFSILFKGEDYTTKEN
jgi:hypothetical protein